MKIKLGENHGFNERAVKWFESFLDKEMTAEEVLQVLTKQTLVPMEIVAGTVFVVHPENCS